MKIVLTESDHDSFAPELTALEPYGIEFEVAQTRNPAELIAAAADADGLAVQYATVTAEVMDGLPKLRAIGRYGVGFDTVDVAAATERGIAVSNVPDYGTEAVSDHAIGLALTAARGIAHLDRDIRAGLWDFVPVRPLHIVGGRVFGIIGLGLIGSATARKAQGLGYEVIAYDIAAEEGATEFRGFPHVPLEELLRRAHVISVHTPLDETSRHLINAQRIEQMRPDVIIVNTSRGGVIDTDALVAALQGGRIAAAALDVHEREPLPPDSPLLGFDNVTLTPHSAWYTEESYGELKRRTVENVADVLTGRVPRNILNPEVLGAPGRNADFPVTS